MIRIRQIKIPVEVDSTESLEKAICKILRINSKEIIRFNIVKKSLDARKKDSIHYVYEVDVLVTNDKSVLKHTNSKDVFVSNPSHYELTPSGAKPLTERPIVVGSGPAGLFCAYILAEYNYRPIIIERGASVDERVKTIETFWQTGILDENTNVQFGEGGAGTFSDGKLNTLVKDPRNISQKVFDIFVGLVGAPMAEARMSTKVPISSTF